MTTQITSWTFRIYKQDDGLTHELRHVLVDIEGEVHGCGKPFLVCPTLEALTDLMDEYRVKMTEAIERGPMGQGQAI